MAGHPQRFGTVEACAARRLVVDVAMLLRGQLHSRAAGVRWFHLLFIFCCASRLIAADLGETRRLYQQGQYAECIRLSEKAISDRIRDEEWPMLLVRSQLALGLYPEAEGTLTNALGRYRASIRLRVLGCEVMAAAGKPGRVPALLGEINELGSSRMSLYRDPPNLVALGKAALMLGADPKVVLENFFDRAKKEDPNGRDAYLASGELALDKDDFGLAAKVFDEALKKFPEDPDIHCGLARAYEPSSPALMLKWLDAALSRNTNYVPAMLLLADHQVDAEEYAAADETLQRALSVNPWRPEAWAYRAVLAHLRNDSKGEAEAREKALQFWKTNPRVDHLIGKKLSQNYRFLEGSAYQRSALSFNEAFLPARIQLAQDLLRLGEESEGWKLAEGVHQLDSYDVTAYNLVTLKESVQKFRNLTNSNLVVRMASREAELYGDQVLDLLQRAQEVLARKYGLTPDHPILVEIFPEQKDFAVRTFGMPHNPGFLGVCFGHVVTANSPASQAGHPANWQAVLWHEFCHVITLQLTKNKMPRWLSEGISVYEERQANPSWGQAMNPQYREMILGGELTPVSRLSSAFLSPKSSLHVQFAYYESSLAVEFLVERFGFDSLKLILHDLAEGTGINEAIAKRTAPMETIEKEFAIFASDRAEKLAAGLDWEKPDLAASAGEPGEAPAPPASRETRRRRYGVDAGGIVDVNSTNYWGLLRSSQKLLGEKKWEEAKIPLQKLIELYPDQTGPQSAYAMLAAVFRSLKEIGPERETLAKLAAIDATAPDAYARLMELGEATHDWPAVELNAQRFLAVNPLLAQPHRSLARASEELGKADAAVRAYQRLLLLDPPDPAEVHFRLARLLRQSGDPSAKRQVLQALEEAPRFGDAQRLLLEIAGQASNGGQDAVPAPVNLPAKP